MADHESLEFSRPILVRSLRSSQSGAPREVSIEANEIERNAMARRLGLPAIASFSCRYRLNAEARGRVLAEATLTTRLTQICVVTLEPFEDALVERFAVRFVPETDMREDDLSDVDSIDETPYAGDNIDIGEAATEQLGLILDPYPRRPGVEIPAEWRGDEGGAGNSDERENDGPTRRPFAALEQLKRRQK
ncbi:DUF177 domain-containing protein [Acetobacter sp. DsW_063]|uniref:DUF177 domain-containing protein n=1 Tax=Acetobacter sp. DsW_063 TaxID=1514894 RepID=UPI000A38BD08|nr:DUF177 domain-containing protein [Acetobacter sp. DsW_063]OUJ16118.1 hypothetical protein HK28_05345 [Acetobacter sp. DsW_063]